MSGSLVVLFALLFFTIGIFSEQRNKRITGTVLWSLTLGILFTLCLYLVGCCMYYRWSFGHFFKDGSLLDA